jgi:hypothetical protein
MVVVLALGGDPHNAVAAIRGHSFGEGHGRNSEQNAALLVSVDVMGKRTEKGGEIHQRLDSTNYIFYGFISCSE